MKDVYKRQMYWFFVTMKVKFRGGFTVHINEKWKFEKFRFLKSKEKKNVQTRK